MYVVIESLSEQDVDNFGGDYGNSRWTTAASDGGYFVGGKNAIVNVIGTFPSLEEANKVCKALEDKALDTGIGERYNAGYGVCEVLDATAALALMEADADDE